MVEVTVFGAAVHCLLFSSAVIGITQLKVIVSSGHHSSGWITGGGSVTTQGMWDCLIHGTCNVAL
jgi:hypothetical protein